MLSDTDVGSIITAAESGARWGYKLLILQLILTPVLYICQELTVRLGLVTGRGLGELILQHFGRGWAWLSVSTLAIACVGALIIQLSGMAGVGLLFGVPTWLTMAITVVGILLMVLTGSHRSVERIAVILGLFELAFVWVALRAHPDPQQLLNGFVHAPFGDYDYLYLVAANIGAVIMPWMTFYQQSASVEKGLTSKDLTAARWETATGAVITQIIMAAVLVATAATIGRANPNAPLQSVQQLSEALTPFLGAAVGRIVFAIGMTGAALIAAIVVSLTAAWSLGEVAGYSHSLEDHPHEARWFYGLFGLCLLLGAAVVSSGVNLVRLSVGVQVLNAVLLPIVLGFLFMLACKVLPDAYRLKGLYAWLVAPIVLITAGFGICIAFLSLVS
jgi:Mn2+/Fe2+ NRAMP family transporter